MPDVFVSYSRRDAEFVSRLATALQARGKDVWIDVAGIRDAEVFPAALRAAVEGSDGFVFVISPESVDSRFCEQEVDHALELNKRVVPLALRPVADDRIPQGIRVRNWIPVGEGRGFDEGVDRLVAALDTDLDWTKEHTNWLLKALEWESKGREGSLLLRGPELVAAERWLSSAAGKDPEPTPLHTEYILASRGAATSRQRVLVGASLAVAVVAIGLLVFALISRGQAVSERATARSQALAAEGQSELANDPAISLLLGMRAVQQKPTSQALFALRAAIDASPLLRSLPGVSNPGSCAPIGLLRTSNFSFTAAYRPGGSSIAEGTCDGTLLLLSPSGAVTARRRLVGGAGSVTYSPDGKLLAVGNARGVALLDPSTGAVRAQLAAQAPATAIAFTADGRRIAAAGPVGVTVWDLRRPGPAGRLLARGTHDTGTMAFSRDGRRLFVGGDDNVVHVYETGSGRPVTVVSSHVQDSAWPEVVAVSPDGSKLAIGHPTNSPLSVTTLYDSHTLKPLYDIASIRNVEISSLAFSPDGARLAIGAEDGTAGVWSVATRQQLVAYQGQTAAVDAMQFSPDGQSVLTASNDGAARLWRSHGSEQTYIETGRTSSPQVVLVGGRAEAIGQLAAPSAGGSGAPRFALLSWSLPRGRPLPSVPLPVPPGLGPSLSPDGRLLLVGPPPGTTGPAFTYSLSQRRVLRRFPPVNVVTAQLSWDNSQVAAQFARSASAAGPAIDMYIASGRRISLAGTPPSQCGGFLNTLSFSRDNRWISGATFCGQVYLWDATSGRLVREVQEGGEVSDTEPSEDGSRLLVGSWDSRATIWDVHTGRPVVTLVGHTRGIDGAQFSPDDSLVLTGSLDHTARLWDARTGHVLRVFNFQFDPQSSAFSSDGRRLVIVDDTGVARVWDTCPGCRSAPALLALARRGAPSQPTTLERAVVGSS